MEGLGLGVTLEAVVLHALTTATTQQLQLVQHQQHHKQLQLV